MKIFGIKSFDGQQIERIYIYTDYNNTEEVVYYPEYEYTESKTLKFPINLKFDTKYINEKLPFCDLISTNILVIGKPQIFYKNIAFFFPSKRNKIGICNNTKCNYDSVTKTIIYEKCNCKAEYISINIVRDLSINVSDIETPEDNDYNVQFRLCHECINKIINTINTVTHNIVGLPRIDIKGYVFPSHIYIKEILRNHNCELEEIYQKILSFLYHKKFNNIYESAFSGVRCLI